MNLFEYEAVSKNGEKQDGVILADSSTAVYEILQAKALTPIDIASVKRVSSKISQEELLMFFLHIDFQLKCGMKINEAIYNFVKSHGNKILNGQLLKISNDLKSGHSLKDAFQNSVFDNVTTGLLRSAENTGNLSEVIYNILEFLKLKKQWKEKVKSVVAYPIFLVMIATCLLCFCSMFLGPQVISLLKDYGQTDVPFLTNFVVNYLPILSLILIGVLISLICISGVFSLSTKLGNRLINYFVAVPKIGDILKKVALWHVCKILHIALDSKLEFMKAFELAIESVTLDNMKKEFEQVKLKIMQGHKIFTAFSSMQYLPKMIATAIYIGEEGNNLNDSMKHISDELYREILFELKQFGRTLGISLTLLTGGIFVFILWGLFSPLYDYIEVIGR